MYDQCPLGIQKCHYFEYHENEVVVRHHNEIETIGVWRTPDAAVMKWIEGGSENRPKKKDLRKYVTTPPHVKNVFSNLKKLQARGDKKLGLGKRKRPSSDLHKATEWHRAVCKIVEQYANGNHEKDVLEAASCFNTPEDAAILRHRVGGKYWAQKRNNPTVQFPVRMANQLRVWYNEKDPHVTADEAAERLRLEYKDSLYVKYVMTAGKIKAFFSGLKSKKVNGVVPELASVATATGYKHWNTLNDLKGEAKRRIEEGSMAKPLRQPTNKAGWAAIIELNDMQAENALSDDAEEAAHCSDGGGAEDDVCADEDDGDVCGDEDDAAVSPEEAHFVYDQLGDDGL